MLKTLVITALVLFGAATVAVAQHGQHKVHKAHGHGHHVHHTVHHPVK